MLTKGDPADKSYYRPTNTLPNFSKIFEKLMLSKRKKIGQKPSTK